jgi:hypothetical protein
VNRGEERIPGCLLIALGALRLRILGAGGSTGMTDQSCAVFPGKPLVERSYLPGATKQGLVPDRRPCLRLASKDKLPMAVVQPDANAELGDRNKVGVPIAINVKRQNIGEVRSARTGGLPRGSRTRGRIGRWRAAHPGKEN